MLPPRKNPPAAQRLYSVDDAAIYLGRTPWAVRELIYRGALPSIRADRRVQVDVRDLDAFIERHRVRAAENA